MRRLALLAALLAQDPGTTTGELPAVRPVHEPLLVWRASTGKGDPVRGEIRVAPNDRLGTPGGAYACLLTEGDSLISLRGVHAAADKGLGLERQGARLVMKPFAGKLL